MMRGRVLITGANGALGGSVVRRFLAAGDRVLAVHEPGRPGAPNAPDAPDAPDAAGGAREEVPAGPDRYGVMHADLTSTEEVDRLFAAALQEMASLPGGTGSVVGSG